MGWVGRGHGGGACRSHVLRAWAACFLERNGVGQGGVGQDALALALHCGGMGPIFWGTMGQGGMCAMSFGPLS
ncbi:hypothetical protein R1flu_007197 [Riccia fluitans]|uniref:Uncharacterized protein n=1 Tax=Riccia fluitans TaxID=41844 RepID=A0ABD1YY60_9MARC